MRDGLLKTCHFDDNVHCDVYYDGRQQWFRNGRKFRIDYATGGQDWFNPETGHLHRLDGPATIYADGSALYYRDGVFQDKVLELNNDINFLYLQEPSPAQRIPEPSLDLSQFTLISLTCGNREYRRYIIFPDDVCLFLLAHPDTMIIQRDSETANHPDLPQEDSRTEPD